MRSIARTLATVVLAIVLVVAGCTSMRQPECMPGEERSVNDLVYFGTSKPTGVVTAEEWAEFLRTAVTPRFPQGLTVWQASGQWKSADGTIASDSSFVLNLVHPGDERSEGAIREIVGAYKTRFNQEAVLRVKSHACVSY